MDKKEEVYTITVHTSETKEVTKEQYINHIEQKMRYRYSELMDARSKAIKALNSVEEEKKKFELVEMELKTLVGPEDANKYKDYISWAYIEQNPRKAKTLEKAL